MRKLPILMSAPMVLACLREIEQPGTGKTQTRRGIDIACDEPPAIVHDGRIIAYDDGDREYSWPNAKAVGDRLYVREAWRVSNEHDDTPPRDLDTVTRVRFEADAHMPDRLIDIDAMTGKLRPAMFLPRWASRITLIVTDVRVQRLQDCSIEDAKAEGIPEFAGDACRLGLVADEPHAWLEWDNRSSVENYRTLWDSLNDDPKKPGRAWRDNPWVAVYTFQPILGNIDEVEI